MNEQRNNRENTTMLYGRGKYLATVRPGVSNSACRNLHQYKNNDKRHNRITENMRRRTTLWWSNNNKRMQLFWKSHRFRFVIWPRHRILFLFICTTFAVVAERSSAAATTTTNLTTVVGNRTETKKFPPSGLTRVQATKYKRRRLTSRLPSEPLFRHKQQEANWWDREKHRKQKKKKNKTYDLRNTQNCMHENGM